MIFTVLKGGFNKRGPKIIMYKYYSKFNVDNFRWMLKDSLNEVKVFSGFYGKVDAVLNEYRNTSVLMNGPS